MSDPRYLFQEVCYEAITPIHVGSGQDVGVVDLPVIRERTTDHPYLPGSGIRGALRSRCRDTDNNLTDRLFGPKAEDDELHAGCVIVCDAHLVLFPVRSAPGVFRWITSPWALRRWRDLREYFLGDPGQAPLPETEPAEGTYLGGATGGRLYLEEYPFDRSEAGSWKWPAQLLGVDSKQVVLVGDKEFLHFVRHATLVRQRNRLSTAKTVIQLFSVEAVPAESRFVGFLGATKERAAGGQGGEKQGEKQDEGDSKAPLAKDEVLEKVRRLLTGSSEKRESHIVLGGDESVGLGVTKMAWTQDAA